MRGADLSALGVVKAIAERRISDTEQDDELAPSLDIPLFAVEKVLSVRPRGRKDGGEDTRRSSTTSSPGRGGSARVSNEPTFMSGVYDDAPGTSGRAPLHGRREGRREFLAAACTSDANARPGDPTATRVLHAAALASEEGTRHDLLLRSEGAGASEFADDPGDASPPTARALPWYHGADARITSMEFSPLCAEARPNNRGGSTPPRMLLCGTEGGGFTWWRRGRCFQPARARATHGQTKPPRHEAFACCAPRARAYARCCGGEDTLYVVLEVM